MKEEIMVTVPLGTVLEGAKAVADLDSIRAIISDGDGYCSKSILAVLGIIKRPGKE